MSYDLHSFFESRARVVVLDFSSASDDVHHGTKIDKLQFLGVGGSFVTVYNEFLTNLLQCVVFGGSSSGSLTVVSGVPQECSWTLTFSHYCF